MTTPMTERERVEALNLAAQLAEMRERLQAVIDWADFATANPAEFDSHGVRNLDGPVFDAAREVLAARLTEGG